MRKLYLRLFFIFVLFFAAGFFAASAFNYDFGFLSADKNTKNSVPAEFARETALKNAAGTWENARLIETIPCADINGAFNVYFFVFSINESAETGYSEIVKSVEKAKNKRKTAAAQRDRKAFEKAKKECGARKITGLWLSPPHIITYP